jgi:hypothetical protein
MTRVPRRPGAGPGQLAGPRGRKTLQDLLAALKGVVAQGDHWKACCPAHQDDSPSLSITEKDGKILLHCFGKGCAVEDVCRAVGWEVADLFPGERPPAGGKRTASAKGKPQPTPKPPPSTTTPAPPPAAPLAGSGEGLTLDELAAAKGLQADFLRGLGLRDTRRLGLPVVMIPYPDAGGTVAAVRYRTALEGKLRFSWRKGDKTLPYGLCYLDLARLAGWVLLVEGESDCWTCWAQGLPALGAPGKANWKAEWAAHLAGIPQVYVWQEPDAEDFVVRVGRGLPGARVLVAPAGSKDPNAAHVQGHDLAAFLEGLTAQATRTAGEVAAAEDARRDAEHLARQAERDAAAQAQLREAVAGWRETAAPVLEPEVVEAGGEGSEAGEGGEEGRVRDPMDLVDRAIVAERYGGDRRAARLLYLSATSRVLDLPRGGMLSHVLLIGPPSAGKSYTVQVVLRLFPEFAHHEVDAGSPKVLIYEDASYAHVVVVFGEADSLPAGEDNPAASAVRNLLQDGHLHYKVVIKEVGSGVFVVQEVVKPGPTVLFTTAIRPLGAQLMSRLWELEVADDQEQIRAALAAQAELELEGPAPSARAMIAYQAILQAGAPWRVRVPFARELAARIGKSPAAPRILRDYARLLSLIKAVTVMRHSRRTEVDDGYYLAEIDDYAYVYEQLQETYAGSASGAGAKVRAVVDAVAVLRVGLPAEHRVSAADLARHLRINKMAATRRVGAALGGKWLINREKTKGAPYDLVLGDPLPEEDGLPKPADVQADFEAAQKAQAAPDTTGGPGGGNTVTPGNNGVLLLVPDGGNTVTPPTEGTRPLLPPPAPELSSVPQGASGNGAVPHEAHEEGAAVEGDGRGVISSVDAVTALPTPGRDGNTPLLRPVTGVTAPGLEDEPTGDPAPDTASAAVLAAAEAMIATRGQRPEQAPSPPPPFVPSGVWQEVPEGTAIPRGGDIRMEPGGKVFARWPDLHPAPAECPASGAAGSQEPDGVRVFVDEAGEVWEEGPL